MKRLRKGALLLLFLGYLASGFFSVGRNEAGLVLRFGKLARGGQALKPGLHYRLPRPFERHIKVGLQVRTTSVGFRVIDRVTGRSPLPEESEWFTGDQNLVKVQIGVQYYVRDPIDFTFNVADDSRFLIRWLMESALTEILGRMTLDEALTNWSRVRAAAWERTQELLDECGAGLVLLNVITEEIKPPDTVWDVFVAINTEKTNLETRVRSAEQYADRLAREAQAESERIRSEAESYAQSLVSGATGTYRAFLDIEKQYAMAPGPTRERLHLEALSQIVPRMRIIQAGNGENVSIIENRN